MSKAASLMMLPKRCSRQDDCMNASVKRNVLLKFLLLHTESHLPSSIIRLADWFQHCLCKQHRFSTDSRHYDLSMTHYYLICRVSGMRLIHLWLQKSLYGSGNCTLDCVSWLGEYPMATPHRGVISDEISFVNPSGQLPSTAG